MQTVRSDRQIRRPGNDPMAGLALRDNLKTDNEFPAHGECGSLPEFGLRGLTGAHHHRPTDQPPGDSNRQSIEDDPQRGCVCHMPVTLTVDKFGLDSGVFSFGEKVHSARGLHATVGDRHEIHEMREEDSRA